MIGTGLFGKKNKEVRLGFSSGGKVLAQGCPYLFSIESLGKQSEKGFFISISGDAVDSGELKLDSIELHRLKGLKFEVTKYGFKKIAKKDGGFAYQLALKNFHIPERYSESSSLIKLKGRKCDADMEMISNEIQFKFTAKFSGEKDSELLIGVFPYENIISGAASKWVTVTADSDYFAKLYKK